MTGSRGMLAAKQPLVVPMLLRLSHFRLSSYVVLVVSKQKGITLVFKTDPLQNVDINSTFDSIAVIQKFIQREIEEQLRQMFREDLPGIIHRLSQQWIKAKVEAPYLNKQFPLAPRGSQPFETMSSPDLTTGPLNANPPPHSDRALSLGAPSARRPRSISGDSATNFHRRTSSRKAISSSIQVPSADSHFPNEYENFDPTYGLRPEGLPAKSGFKGFSSLFTPNKGLANLTEEPSDSEEEEDFVDDGESTSFDVVTAPGLSPPASVYAERISIPEYETIPAVGGGTITRPRILHSQSSIQPPAGITPRPSLNPYSRSQGNTRSGIATPNIFSRHHSSGSHFSGTQSLNDPPRSTPHFPPRSRTPDTVDSSPSMSDGIDDQHSQYQHIGQQNSIFPTHYDTHIRYLSSNPNHISYPTSQRRLSISSLASHQTAMTNASNNNPVDSIMVNLGTSPGKSNSVHTSPYPNIGSESYKITRPSLNADSIHHLSTLSHSNHTLSPYTCSLSHFTVRSVPPRTWNTGGLARGGLNGTTGERQQPIKAKRKRIFYLNGKKTVDSSRSAPTKAGAVFPPVSTVNAEINPNFAFGRATAGEFSFGSGHDPGELGMTGHRFIPPEFDAEDMDRYFRSNDDLPVVRPSPLLVSGNIGSLGLSSASQRSTAIQQTARHLPGQHKNERLL